MSLVDEMNALVSKPITADEEFGPEFATTLRAFIASLEKVRRFDERRRRIFKSIEDGTEPDPKRAVSIMMVESSTLLEKHNEIKDRLEQALYKLGGIPR